MVPDWMDIAWLITVVAGVGASVVIQIMTFRRLHIVVEQTNGMSHRLEELAGIAGEVRGRAEEAARKEGIEHDASTS